MTPPPRTRATWTALFVAAAASVATLAWARSTHADGGESAVATTREHEAELELDAVLGELRAGRFSRAEELGRRFLLMRGADALAPRAAVATVEAMLYEATGGRPAIEHGIAGELPPDRRAEVERLLARFESSADAPTRQRMGLARGLAALLAHDEAAAIAALLPLRPTVVGDEDQTLLETVLYAAARTRDLPTALEALDALRATCVRESSCETIDGATSEIVENGLDEGTARELALGMDTDRRSFPVLARRAIEQATRAADFDTIRRIFARARAGGASLDTESTAIAERLERGVEADPDTLGIIVPLTGPMAPIGIAIVEAASRATGLPPTGRPTAHQPRLVIRDSHGVAGDAARAVGELFFIHRAVAILGPPDAASAEAAAERASALGVPFVSLVDVDPRAFVHVASALPVTSLLEVAHRVADGPVVALAPPDADIDDLVARVRHDGGRLSTASRDQLRAQGDTWYALLARTRDVPRLVTGTREARARLRPRRNTRFVMTRAAFDLLSERARRDVEGSRVIDLPERRGASSDASAVYAARAEWAIATIRALRGDDRASVEAALGAARSETRDAVVYTVVRGTLRADP